MYLRTYMTLSTEILAVNEFSTYLSLQHKPSVLKLIKSLSESVGYKRKGCAQNRTE